jgi:predicted ATPase/class 3 adenylate cyclase/Tfp pilus assembly protein PilF
LLLTDVVDSTHMAEELGDVAMAELWARHDRVARDLLVEHHGLEIDKTDGFLLLFERTADAVTYALAYHRALVDLELAARAGLHVGPVILTENAPTDVARGAKPLEVDGLAKPTAARVMSVARGGQTLLTEAARHALGETPLRVESHGHWRMKGVSEPMELFEIGAGNAPFQPPPDGGKVYRVLRRDDVWLPVHHVKHSLPAERDAFVGRKEDLDALDRLLGDGHRLVSVLGIGGTGKTRLVTRYGWTWLGDWPGGVWFCDLSEARSRDGLVSAVARALDVSLGADDPVAQLGHAIAGRRRCLVLLDNFEQVTAHAATTLGRWLDSAGEAAFVVTTREVLGLPGETALALSPLGRGEAIELFAARAAQAQRGFKLPEADRPIVGELVELLDGLPLAIELAAARTRVMPPTKLLQRMSQRFKLLTSRGRRDRHATLRAALDWSWDLLDADEQAALAQLSVFEGGFTLDAAEAVLAVQDVWPTDLVQALVDKSLVRRVSEERFDLLVSVQVYAAERLDERGEVEETQSRHGRWAAELVPEHKVLHGFDGAALRASLTVEVPNLVQAHRSALARGDAALAARTALAAADLLGFTGPVGMAIDMVERARVEGLDPDLALDLHWSLGRLRHMAGQPDVAEEAYQAAIGLARELGRNTTRASATLGLATIARGRGQLERSAQLNREIIELARAIEFPAAEATALANLASVSSQLGHAEEAWSFHHQALEVNRSVGDEELEATVRIGLANLAMAKGDTTRAIELLQTAQQAARHSGSPTLQGIALGNLGRIHGFRNDTELALRSLREAVELHRHVGSPRYEGLTLINLGALLVNADRFEEARDVFEDALRLLRRAGAGAGQAIALANLGNIARLQGRLEVAEEHLGEAIASARRTGNRPQEGTYLRMLGMVRAAAEQFDEATALLRQAASIHRETEVVGELAQDLGSLGEVLAQQGDVAAASEPLEQALALALRTQMAGYAAHVEAVIQSIGEE